MLKRKYKHKSVTYVMIIKCYPCLSQTILLPPHPNPLPRNRGRGDYEKPPNIPVETQGFII